jgi:predicted CoA-binding protein
VATLREAAREFLALKRIAVAGVSRTPNQAANGIYCKLRSSGCQVHAINPNAERVEGDPCYANLAAIPGGVDGLVIATRPAAAEELVRECARLGVRHVWMHRSLGQGSVSARAAAFCRENGISVIAGACPMMFAEPVDLAHKCMHVVLGWFGQLPKRIDG